MNEAKVIYKIQLKYQEKCKI